MAINVYRVFQVREGRIESDGPWPRRCRFQPGVVYALLTKTGFHAECDGPNWDLRIEIGEGKSIREVDVPLETFLTAEEYDLSLREPIPFSRIRAWNVESPKDGNLDWLWIFRDAFYVTERPPSPSEVDEVTLRIKAMHFQQDEEIRRLREQVANFDAIDRQKRAGGRKPIPDDVKLLIWSRDGGACVRCGSPAELHFDHIIPVAKGGGDHSENIQLLCRTCNLSKNDRIA